jgi:hypothetical protein
MGHSPLFLKIFSDARNRPWCRCSTGALVVILEDVVDERPMAGEGKGEVVRGAAGESTATGRSVGSRIVQGFGGLGVCGAGAQPLARHIKTETERLLPRPLCGASVSIRRNLTGSVLCAGVGDDLCGYGGWAPGASGWERRQGLDGMQSGTASVPDGEPRGDCGRRVGRMQEEVIWVNALAGRG